MALAPTVPDLPDSIPSYRRVTLGKVNKFSNTKDPYDRAWYAVEYGEAIAQVYDVAVIGPDTALKVDASDTGTDNDNLVGLFLTAGTENSTYKIRIGAVTVGGDVIYNTVNIDVVLAGNVTGLPLATGDQTDGPNAPPSASNGTVVLQAGGVITKYQCLMFDGTGKVVAADPSGSDFQFAGISTAAAVANAFLAVAFVGALINSTWAWTPGEPIYVGAAGALTQTVPTAGTLQQVGTAISATSMILITSDAVIL